MSRQKLFIDREFQAALARRVAVHWLLLMASGWGATCLLVALANPTAGFSEHVRSARLHTGGFVLVMVFLLPLFVYDTIKLSHRVAGPVARIRGLLRALAAGDTVAPLRLRKHDFWAGMADEFNAVAERFQEQRAMGAPAEQPQPEQAAKPSQA